ncbi:Killer protein [Stenotrophomonas sp. ESTM1D_MKCIP4_1]|uniref:type II toxin-antitoxin system RelE/ParE family toxin n=1 Tax=Stenotrophomonas sp. ESTM1D_MKCIP4_1 TaxID=2072414 RepID=UPI000D53F579|nr:type II toxin-antitoxin system RelE/ParE family toxin [Stenotrophomonas sp. ESTM1D_MKCIP4_1]AWH55538.1 Killer protein [Stenotrophomonas sp. ESTM1D_MKCIP4_1]
MIVSFRHKGLRALYDRADASGVRADHVGRLRRLLHQLDQANLPGDMGIPGNRLHPLQGNYKGYWSVSVSASWRLVFRFRGIDVELVDYLDYH